MTIGATVAGVAAVGGFGSIAALSYDGAATTDVVTAAVSTTDSSTSTATSATTSGTAGATVAPSATSAPAVTWTTGSAHASTGGS
jgi:hypothetical protein